MRRSPAGWPRTDSSKAAGYTARDRAHGQSRIGGVLTVPDTIDVFLPRIYHGIRIEVENVTQGWYLWETFDRFLPVDASVLYRSIAIERVRSQCSTREARKSGTCS